MQDGSANLVLSMSSNMMRGMPFVCSGLVLLRGFRGEPANEREMRTAG